MVQTIPIDTRELAARILKQVNGMRNEKKHCDFVIKVGMEEFHVHRNILCASSDYFDKMLSHPMKETESGVVEMNDVDSECVMICIDHMYGKEVSISPEKYEPLMYVASLLQLQSLSDAIPRLIEANLSLQSFFLAKKIADTYGCSELQGKCLEFAEKNFGSMSVEKKFGELEESYVKKVIMSMKTEESEEMKLEIVLRWVKHHPDRHCRALDLLKCLDFSLIPEECCRYLLEKESIFQENFDVFKLLSTVVMDKVKIGIRKPGQQAGNTVIVTFDRRSGRLQSFNPRQGTWKQMFALSDNIKGEHFSAVALDRYIYIFMEDRSVHRLNLHSETGTWERMQDMLEEHGRSPPVVVLDGTIYVIGGSYDVVSASVEKLDDRRWKKLKDKPCPSQRSSLATLNGYIYILGGWIDDQVSSAVQRFKPAESKWADVAPMTEKKSYLAATTYDSKIYALGGFIEDHFKTVECYEPERNEWTILKEMLTYRSWFRG